MGANHGRRPWAQIIGANHGSKKARADGFKTVVRLLQPTSIHLFGQGKVILKENSWYTQAYAARNCTEYPKVHRLY